MRFEIATTQQADARTVLAADRRIDPAERGGYRPRVLPMAKMKMFMRRRNLMVMYCTLTGDGVKDASRSNYLG